MENTSLTSLNTDVLKLVINNLNLPDIAALCLVCKKLEETARSEWQKKHVFYLPYQDRMLRPNESKSWSKLDGSTELLLYRQPKIEGDSLPPQGWVSCEFSYDQLILLTKIISKEPLILTLAAKITANHLKDYVNSKKKVINPNYEENLPLQLIK